MSAEDLEKLVREGAIERVAADRAAAGRDLNDALDHLDITDHLRAFDDLRRLRNRSEYGAVAVGEDAASEAITRSRAIVEAIRMELGE